MDRVTSIVYGADATRGMAREAAIAASEGLDRAMTLPVGTGKVDAFTYTRLFPGTFGVAVDASRRLGRDTAIFSRVWHEVELGRSNSGAVAGFRWQW